MRRLALLVLFAATPAVADFEFSEHTVQLVGSDADTLGVTIDHDENGWTMRVRPAPGADPITTKLALPDHHAHYLAYVTPRRDSIAIVETSAGRAPRGTDTIGWVYRSDGVLLRSWTFAAVVDGRDLAHSGVSIAHFSALRSCAYSDGVYCQTSGARLVHLAADATTFR